jgi:hypothetical protein
MAELIEDVITARRRASQGRVVATVPKAGEPLVGRRRVAAAAGFMTGD